MYLLTDKTAISTQNMFMHPMCTEMHDYILVC